jgi:zinc transport system ATP-binding protein
MSKSQAIHPVDQEIAVKFDAVSFSYKGGAADTAPVLEKVSFHIHQGEFVALAGPNGSGKTTVLKLILGLEQPTAGRIERFGISGENSEKGHRHGRWRGQWRGRLGYVPQQPPADQSFPILVRDVVRMGLLHPSKGYAVTGKAAAAEAMQRAGIADLAERSYRALSGGQRRRVLVARALAAMPDMLILDEPTANMDAESETRLFETLGQLKARTTILIVTHDTDFVSVLTDRVLCLGDEACSRGGVVQHRISPDPRIRADPENGPRRSGSGAQGARVLHGENIPADDCYEQ